MNTCPAVTLVGLLCLLLPPGASARQSTGAEPPLLATVPTPPPGTSSAPQSMAGAPLQVGDLPPGTITVRVIRGNFENNVQDQPVVLHLDAGSRTLTAATGPEGRAQFVGATVGSSVWVEATLDGEQLTSQTFEVPSKGGVRLILSTTGTPAGESAPVSAPPVAQVSAAGFGPSGPSGKSPAQWLLAGLFAGMGIGFGAHAYTTRRRGVFVSSSGAPSLDGRQSNP